MEAIKIEALSFSYPDGTQALDNINLRVNKGEFLTFSGPSGCGKTTLLRLLCPSIAPRGALQGKIFLENRDIEELSPRELAKKVAYVPQRAEDGLVTDTVWHELAFGPENLGVPPEEIRLRVAETAGFFGISDLFHRPINSLSGGQKQMVSLAAAMTLRPELLILDEPGSQLDPIGRRELFQALERVNTELGVTVLLAEHILNEALPISSRLAVMEAGHILLQGAPETVCQALLAKKSPHLYSMPAPLRVWAALGGGGTCPFTPLAGQKYLELRLLSPLPPPEEATLPDSGVLALQAKGLWFRHEKRHPDVLRELDLTVTRGEIVALMGGSGSGKSTLLAVLAGLAAPWRGRCQAVGKTALLPQDPRTLFLRSTLRADLTDALSPREKKAELPKELLRFWELEPLLDRHPYDLSGGELQRAAMAKLILTRPDILLLDEPAKGMDDLFKLRFAKKLQELCHMGKTIFIVSHDLDFCARCAHRCAMLFDGRILGPTDTRSFFASRHFYTTTAGRMAGSLVPGAVLEEDLLRACGVEPPEPPAERPYSNTPPPRRNPPPPEPGKIRKKPSPKALFLAGLFFSLAALTAVLGPEFLGERRYYITALLMLFWCSLGLTPVFESRRPGARELCFIAALSALAVSGRAALYMLPQCKPTLALIILTGASLGGRAGFAAGAMTAFVSNFFFGHGPWTPWQMLALGLTGMVAGLLFARHKSKPRWLLCLYGALSSLILYSGIVNLHTLLFSYPDPTWEAAAAVYLLGLGPDLALSGATTLFLFFLTKPLLEKLERAKEKFGLTAPI